MTKTHFTIALAALTLFLSTPVHAKHPKEVLKPSLPVTAPLALEDRQHLLNDSFTVVKTVHEIPAPVYALLFQHVSNDLDGMADPGEKWQEGDVVGPKMLPFRRLILAANSAGYSVIYDEHGGFGYYQQVSLYRLTKGLAKLLWQTTVDTGSRTLTFEQLRALIRSGKYHALK